MIGSDLVRGVVLIPVAIAGLAGGLPLWGLVVASFVLETATSYFEPAYGATVPTLVDRANVQQANALVQATAQALSIGGWALAAALLTFMPVSVFFAVNSVVVPRLGRADRSHPPAGTSTTGTRRSRGSARASPRYGRYPMLAACGDRARRRRHDHRGHVDRRRADARARHAPPRRRRLLDRDGRLRGRLDRRGRRARAGADPPQGAREPCSPGRCTCPATASSRSATSLPLAVAGAFFAATGQSSSVVLAQLGGAGAGAGLRARPRARCHLAHPPRRARDRAAARLAALRVRRAHAQCSAPRRSRCRSSGSSRSPARRS